MSTPEVLIAADVTVGVPAGLTTGAPNTGGRDSALSTQHPALAPTQDSRGDYNPRPCRLRLPFVRFPSMTSVPPGSGSGG